MKYISKNRTSVRVRYGETDQMGYCYYGNYAQFCEVGRVEALRELGLSYRSIEEAGVMLPVSSFSIKYLRPAKYDDLINIDTTIVRLEGVKLFFIYELYNEKEELIAKADTTLVFVAKETMRPTAPPTSFLTIVAQHEK